MGALLAGLGKCAKLVTSLSKENISSNLQYDHWEFVRITSCLSVMPENFIDKNYSFQDSWLIVCYNSKGEFSWKMNFHSVKDIHFISMISFIKAPYNFWSIKSVLFYNQPLKCTKNLQKKNIKFCPMPACEHFRSIIFSSLEHNVLRVSYCDRSMSGVRSSVCPSVCLSVLTSPTLWG